MIGGGLDELMRFNVKEGVMGEIENVSDVAKKDELKVEGFFRTHVGWTAVGSVVSVGLVVLAVAAWLYIRR